jgi:hypothetical protein
LGLNLDTHENLLSLLQSNVSPGQFDLSQTDNYLATRSKTITKSIAMSVQTMTSIVVCFNINRNRRMDVLPDEGRESKSILPRKTGLFKIAQFGPTFSLLPNNQDQYVSRLRQSFGASTHEKSIWLSSASAYQPDVPLQITDCVDVAKTVRDSDRVLEAGKDAN